jgi:hypothetical protein
MGIGNRPWDLQEHSHFYSKGNSGYHTSVRPLEPLPRATCKYTQLFQRITGKEKINEREKEKEKGTGKRNRKRLRKKGKGKETSK